jgi:hypothetical protein
MKSFVVLLLLGPALIFSQTKTWTPSSASEFSQGILTNAVVTNQNGGEVRLSHPLIHQGEDSLDSSIPEYVSYDDSASAWVYQERLYVQKFDSNNQPLTSAIIANDGGGIFRQTPPGIALLNSGEFVVGWRASITGSGTYVRFVQFFDSARNKIGTNQRVFRLSNATASIPLPIADRANKRYVLLSSEQVDSTLHFQLYALLFSADGVRLRDSIDFVPTGGSLFELNPSGTIHNGRLYVAWEGNDVGYGPGDIYAALYDSNCVPMTTPMMLIPASTSPSLASDEDGNICLTSYWFSGIIPATTPDKIYGQVLDSSMRKIGGVVQLSNLSGVYICRMTAGSYTESRKMMLVR